MEVMKETATRHKFAAAIVGVVVAPADNVRLNFELAN